MNLGHLDFDIVSDFDILISDFSLPDNSLPDMMIQPTKLCGYVVPAGLFMAIEAQFIANRSNAQKSTSIRSLSMSLGKPADCFMQNEPNFRKSQMNITKVLTTDYENKTLSEPGKNEPKTNPNEPKTNPIKANFRKAKMNVIFYSTVVYENKPPLRTPKKQTQFSKGQKQMQNYLPQRIMKMKTPARSEITNPNKANHESPGRTTTNEKILDSLCFLNHTIVH